MPDTITITDDRTGKTVTVPITGGVFPCQRAARARPVAVHLRPGVHADRGVQVARSRTSTATTASCATAATRSSSSPRQSTYLEVAYLLLNGELPTSRAARRSGRTTSRTTRSSTRTCASGSSTASTTTPTRWACSSSSLAALGTFYNDAKDDRRQGSRDKQILRLIAKTPDARGDVLPVLGRPAVRLPGQRPVVPGQLPQHDVEDRRRTRSTRASSGRWTCCSSSTPTTSRTAAPRRCASSAPARPTRTRRRPPPRRALYGPLHGGANEAVVRMLTEIGSIENVPAFIEAVKSGERPPDGLRPPRLQELRPAGDDHQEDRVRRVRGHRQEPAARHRAEARGGRAQRRRTSSAASCTRTSTSTRA